MDTTTLQSLLNGSSDGSSSPLSSLIDVNALLQPLMPYIMALTAVSIVITILYLISLIEKWRANKAIIETRNILREMNERDKARSAPTQPKEAAPVRTAPVDISQS